MIQPLSDLSHLKVDDFVYLAWDSNECNGMDVIVRSIGRKWLTVGTVINACVTRFNIKTGKSEDDTQYRLYRSRDEHHEYCAELRLKRDLRQALHNALYALTLDQLIAISKIVNLEDN